MSLHHHIQNEEVRLNNTIGDNNKLKVEIDIMRKEILFAKDGIRVMQEEIAKLKDQSRGANQESIAASKTTTEHNNWILSLKAKSEDGKEQFELEVKKLQERLQDPDDTEPTKEEELDKGKADGSKQKFDNPIEILKIRLKNITNKNREKQRLLAQYTRNARVIEEAFEVIKEGSGIKNLDEIVTTFIKSEEQNYSLWNYVNQLGIECDIFEEQNAQLDRETNKHMSVHNFNKRELKKKVSDMDE